MKECSFVVLDVESLLIPKYYYNLQGCKELVYVEIWIKRHQFQKHGIIISNVPVGKENEHVLVVYSDILSVTWRRHIADSKHLEDLSVKGLVLQHVITPVLHYEIYQSEIIIIEGKIPTLRSKRKNGWNWTQIDGLHLTPCAVL